MSREKIPILRMGDLLLVTIQADLYDRLAESLESDLVQMIAKTGAQGVLIDISAISILDSFMGRIIGNIATMSKVLDAETVVVGMQPAVAITLVELGLHLNRVASALNVEQGMKLLRSRIYVKENGLQGNHADRDEQRDNAGDQGSRCRFPPKPRE